jgi:uncharacterized protein (TIGR03067 family)
MRAFSVTVLLAAVNLALAACTATGADKDDLQGVWVGTSGEINGKPAPAEEIKRTRFTFKADKLLVRGFKDDMREIACSYHIAADKAPKQIDIMAGEKTLAGIYEIKGDTLRICYENGSNPRNRPTRFATNSKEELVLFVFKRQKSRRTP